MAEGYDNPLYNSSSDDAQPDNGGLLAETLVNKEKYRQYLERDGSIQGLHKYINESFNEWVNTDLHIGVFGAGGAGKSSLINALRNIKNTDKHAAEVSVVENKRIPTAYTFPTHNRVKLWDIPGLGTESYPKNLDTLKKLEISKFEVVLVVFSTRLSEIDFWLADESLKVGCFVLFVRTKIDHDVNDNKDQMTETQCLEIITQSSHDMLNKHSFPRKNTNIELFLVSSSNPLKYDLTKLRFTLEKLLSDRATRLIRQLEPLVLEMIEMERRRNMERYSRRKLYAAVYGFLPLPVLETVLGALSVEEIVEKSKRKFRLDEGSVVGLSSVIDEKSRETYADEKKIAIEMSDGHSLRQKTEDDRYGWFIKYSKYILPAVGSILSCAKEVQITEACISEVSNVLAADLRKLVEIRFRHLIRDLSPKLTEDTIS